ncbi:hypothetical protein BDY21DRAFT_339317 [Lineolata rhizophorae]|uniref:HD domain-containing protein n=1 Tax=Lineolata rhizophorae TaxID=578093 RepID=A0A6A6P4L3_9PEZI|nr:hypothetical protein BDY21DRAFT_339317 [Lineolata rhizophorae]
MSDQKGQYGWTAVPRSQSSFFKIYPPKDVIPLKVADIMIPVSPAVTKVSEYAKANLSEETYNHSMRVFYYGAALIKQHFPHFATFTETYLLACLLHDIGTTPANLQSTFMSFEWYGAYLSLDLLQKQCGAPQAQAEAVCEAIVRHQDLGETGDVTALGQLIQLATVFDNIGMNPSLIHSETIKHVTAAFPRKMWSGCFASVIREEIGLKPWCHTTAIEGFAEKVEGNALMKPFD